MQSWIFDNGIISIHTPAWGATADRYRPTDYVEEFQSTLPRGERRQRRNVLRLKGEFQSTLPRGERLQNCTKAILTKVKFYALLHTF